MGPSFSLAKDEAAALEAARQQALFADDEAFDDPELDDEGENYDGDENAVRLDVGAITRITYTRGFIKKLSDLRRGRGLRVTEWAAPDIPQAILDSIEDEELDALEGEWGDSKLGEPIQVDVIDLETDDDVFSIEVFNRAIFLTQTDSAAIQQIDRVCGVLEAADPHASGPAGARDRSAPDEVAIAAQEIESSVDEARSNLANVLKQQRRQPGTCALCGDVVSRTAAQAHLIECAPAHDAPVAQRSSSCTSERRRLDCPPTGSMSKQSKTPSSRRSTRWAFAVMRARPKAC